VPQINVLYWNLENFGATGPYKSDYGPLTAFVALIAHAVPADILLIQELKNDAIAGRHLEMLQDNLCSADPPLNNWYYEWIKGSVRFSGIPEPPVPPYATSDDLEWDDGHREGYAVFWNQNIAKFTLTRAPPLPGNRANRQSEVARSRHGSRVPPGGLVAPSGANAYKLPRGTRAPAGAGIGGSLQPGEELDAAMPVPAGMVLPTGTTIGSSGVTLAAPTNGRNEIVIPGDYVLTEPCTLPAAPTVLVPEHALSLVLQGRDTSDDGTTPSQRLADISKTATPFVQDGSYAMQDLYFPQGKGLPASERGPRRPAYVTLDINIDEQDSPQQRLVPLIVYHAPSKSPASTVGMQRAAYSQPIYQAYDWTAGAWIDNARSVLGGDMNVRTDLVAFAYNAFTKGFAEGGASCRVRVYHDAPAGKKRSDNVLNKTCVWLRDPPIPSGKRILDAVLASYRRGAIDNVFYRGFTTQQAPAPTRDVVDLLTVIASDFLQPGVIQRFAALQIVRSNVVMATRRRPAMPMKDVVSVINLAYNVEEGEFTGPGWARTAAEFVRHFVSDHMPVVFTMQL
jgi:hypothetical protein